MENRFIELFNLFIFGIFIHGWFGLRKMFLRKQNLKISGCGKMRETAIKFAVDTLEWLINFPNSSKKVNEIKKNVN